MRRLLLLAAVSACACSGPDARRAPASGTMSGLDVLVAQGFKPLRGKKIALIADASALDRRGRRAADLLAAAPSVRLTRVYAPAGGRIEEARFDPDRLAGLDVLVFDAQDSGARFDVLLAGMALALEAAKAAGVDFMVLDRPNPIRGDIVEGPLLADPSLRFLTPTAFFQVPVRHGLTAGEMALWHNRSVGHRRLSVVKMQGWERALWHDQTGLAAPNMPGAEASALYPGIGIFEASNIAVGRGTPAPFRWIGAPWMKAEEIVSRLQGTVEGVEFSVQDYTPAKSVFAGQACRGVKITVTDRDAMRSLAVFRHLALALREFNPKEFEWRWDEAKRMVGVDEFRLLWETGAGDEAFIALFDKGPRDFEPSRRSVLLY
ncbi:MAG: DUF1343 domain-containing protein [Elusimicrobia bacterium]|nr:DUF1343 domain-containing protein [Elusimicrobiota bacterium]